MVFRRITYDLRSGNLLYDGYFDSIDAQRDKGVCYRELPMTTDILTRLYYLDYDGAVRDYGLRHPEQVFDPSELDDDDIQHGEMTYAASGNSI